MCMFLFSIRRRPLLKWVFCRHKLYITSVLNKFSCLCQNKSVWMKKKRTRIGEWIQWRTYIHNTHSSQPNAKLSFYMRNGKKQFFGIYFVMSQQTASFLGRQFKTEFIDLVFRGYKTNACKSIYLLTRHVKRSNHFICLVIKDRSSTNIGSVELNAFKWMKIYKQNIDTSKLYFNSTTTTTTTCYLMFVRLEMFERQPFAFPRTKSAESNHWWNTKWHNDSAQYECVCIMSAQ